MTDKTKALLPVTQDRLVYIRWSDDGQHIRKWAREPFEGATVFANAGNGAPLGPFDADDHYPVAQLPFALRSIAENIHVECADHVLEDMVRIVTDAANVIEARISHSLPGDVGTVDLEAVAKEICDAVYPHHVIKYDTPAAIRSVVRILAALPQPVAARQSHWLIERRCDPPQWSIEPRPRGIGAFYSDIHRAHRFASKHEASEAMRNMAITAKERAEYFVSEHVWAAALTPSPCPGDVGAVQRLYDKWVYNLDWLQGLKEADDLTDFGDGRLSYATEIVTDLRAVLESAALTPSATISEPTKRMEQTLGARFQATPSALSGDAGEGE